MGLIAHTAAECTGSCKHHPLLKGDVLDLQIAMNNGCSWGDILYIDEQERLASETPEQKRLRLEKQAIEERSRERETESYRMKNYAERIAIRANRKKKYQLPCKWVCGRNKGEDCWAWEYTDPKDGKRKTPRSCEYLHPGEDGWRTEWMDSQMNLLQFAKKKA